MRRLFGHDPLVEVDAPGLNWPILNDFVWTRLPHPVLMLNRGGT
jgi:hypothetical protein